MGFELLLTELDWKRPNSWACTHALTQNGAEARAEVTTGGFLTHR